MSNWSMDEQLRKAQESPEWQNLPGQGKPLNLNEDPNTPSDMRLAYKILKDNDLAPAWIEEGKGLDHDFEKLINQIRQVIRVDEIKPALREAVTAYNKRALNYNLKVPPGIAHKRYIDLNREINNPR
ncbi:MAG TPA: DUF1992 domain-containing protein [Phototrophicaceae bacterium]|jgi:hypothetical protein|nr:DUF1992 domain-containing protein [Phototrophicaceae bacterium]